MAAATAPAERIPDLLDVLLAQQRLVETCLRSPDVPLDRLEVARRGLADMARTLAVHLDAVLVAELEALLDGQQADG